MLTGYQTEIVAFYRRDAGELICRDCAVSASSEVLIEKCELGLDDEFSAICRYSLDEQNGERVYEAAEERVREWAADHPAFAGVVLDRDARNYRGLTQAGYRLLDKVADRLEDAYAETCGDCGDKLG